MAAIAVIYLSLAWIKRVHFFAPEEKRYVLSFDHIAGLLEGDPVFVRGYLAGRVTTIIPKAKSVEVKIMLDTNIQLFEDARAEVQLKELMSGKQLTIFQGNSQIPFSHEQIIPGTASLDFSSGFSTISNIMTEFSTHRIQHLFNQIDSIFSTANGLLSNINPQSLEDILIKTAQILTEIQTLTSEIQQRELIEKIDTVITKTNQTISSANYSLDKVSKIVDSIDPTNIDSLIQNLWRLSQEGEKTLTEIQLILNQLENQKSFGGRLLYDSNLSLQLDSTILHLDQVLKQIRDEKIYISVGKNKNKKSIPSNKQRN